MEVTFLGAAREVTGSCHLLRVNGRTIALDCGMFQGKRSDVREKNLKLPLPIDELDAVILSHAHIDHAGRLPLLAKHGYSKTIWATSATRDLSAIMLADSAYIQEKDVEFLTRRGRERAEPLYAIRDAVKAVDLMVSVPYDRPFDVIPGVQARFVDAGHILGSASIVLDCTEGATTRRLVFSADVGRTGLPIIRDPVIPGNANAVIMESTYGDRDHESVDQAREHLASVVRDTAARGGRVLIPAFAVGRTQEIVYDLHVLYRSGSIPAIPIFIDSPLAVDATTIFVQHPELFDKNENLVQQVTELFQFDLVHFTRKAEESKALNQARGPMVIVAASGMAEAGRILHHLAHGASDPRNTILIVGFQAEHTLGRRIVERRETIKVFGDEIPLRARVEVIYGYSAHADRSELTQWLAGVASASPGLGPVWLVHGEPAPQDALMGALVKSGYRVECPLPGSVRTL